MIFASEAMLRHIVCLALILASAWSQDLTPDQVAALGKNVLAQMDAAIAKAKSTGEKTPPADLERIKHLRAYSQAAADRKWTEAFQEATWLADHDDFPPTLR